MPKLENGNFDLDSEILYLANNKAELIDLFCFIEQGDLDSINNLLSSKQLSFSDKCKVSYEDLDGSSITEEQKVECQALLFASDCGHAKLVQCFAKVITDKSKKEGYLDYALWRAASKGHVNCVDALLKAGANINSSTKYEDTALAMALTNQNEFVVEYLLKKPELSLSDQQGANKSLLNNANCLSILRSCINPNEEKRSLQTFLDIGRERIELLLKYAGSLHEHKAFLSKVVKAFRQNEENQRELGEDSLYLWIRRRTQEPMSPKVYDVLAVSLLVVGLPIGLAVLAIQAILRTCKHHPVGRPTIGELMFGKIAERHQENQESTANSPKK